jgi:hypothetical protein
MDPFLIVHTCDVTHFSMYILEMSACALRRWGPGTTCIRESTPAEKEVAQKLAAMRAEREKQDTMWGTNTTAPMKPLELEKYIQPSTEQHLSKR